MPIPIIKQVPTLWTALEQIRGLSAISAVWREYAGNDFPALKNFLDASDDVAGSVPCSRCACDHDVITLPDRSLVGVCRCHEIGIHDLELTRADIILWRLNWQKLGRAICQAFGLASKYAKFGPAGTAQIGTWSADAVPVILTIQWNGHELPAVIAELALRLKRPFILLSPTNTHLTAHCQELLAHANSEFFALDSHLLLTAHGAFQPRSLPGEIFARFRPEPQEEIDENDARRVFAILEKLNLSGPPTEITVFGLYCKEELSAEQISKKCRCSKLTVLRRLKVIRAATGRDPRDLRRLSPHFDKMEKDIADDRAKRVRTPSILQ